MQEKGDTLDVPTMARAINKEATRYLSREETQPELSGVRVQQTDSLPRPDRNDTLASLNAILASGQFHLFLLIAGKVYVKVREIHIDRTDNNFLAVLVDGERDDTWIMTPWYSEFQAWLGVRRFIY